MTLKNILKNIYFKIKYIRSNVRFNINTRISKDVVFGGYNVIGKNTDFAGEIGLGSYIGENGNVNASIGKFCSIGHNVTTLSGTHPADKYVSSCPSFYSTGMQNNLSFVKENTFEEKVYVDDQKKFPVIIGNDVWIGYGAIIIAGVKIADGAVIAAGAVVSKDVEPYSIVGGVPAKMIRKRFNGEIIEFLLKFKWWDKPLDWLRNNVDTMSNVNDLYEKYKDCV